MLKSKDKIKMKSRVDIRKMEPSQMSTFRIESSRETKSKEGNPARMARTEESLPMASHRYNNNDDQHLLRKYLKMDYQEDRVEMMTDLDLPVVRWSAAAHISKQGKGGPPSQDRIGPNPVNAELKQMETKIQSYLVETIVLKSNIEDLKNGSQKIKKENENLQSTINNLRRNYDNVQRENLELINKVDNFVTVAKDLQKENEDLKNKVKNLEIKNVDVNANLKNEMEMQSAEHAVEKKMLEDQKGKLELEILYLKSKLILKELPEELGGIADESCEISSSTDTRTRNMDPACKQLLSKTQVRRDRCTTPSQGNPEASNVSEVSANGSNLSGDHGQYMRVKSLNKLTSPNLPQVSVDDMVRQCNNSFNNEDEDIAIISKDVERLKHDVGQLVVKTMKKYCSEDLKMASNEFQELAKSFSHEFREQIKEKHLADYVNLLGVELRPEEMSRIIGQILLYFTIEDIVLRTLDQEYQTARVCVSPNRRMNLARDFTKEFFNKIRDVPLNLTEDLKHQIIDSIKNKISREQTIRDPRKRKLVEDM